MALQAVAAVTLLGPGAAVPQAAAAGGCGTHVPDGRLTGVAAVSPSAAWAVGASYAGTAPQTLTERWNGAVWCRVPSPDPGGGSRDNTLTAVTATSPSDVWAVGYTGDETLILHWNGSGWRRVPSPDPGGATGMNNLTGVASVSPSDAWAVRSTSAGTLILHWNGTAWTRVASP